MGDDEAEQGPDEPDDLHREEIRRAYDELAGTYAEWRSADGRELELLESVLEPLSADARVLDAGCGQGRPVLSRIDERAAAVGLDFSRSQLRLAAGAVPDAGLVQGDLTEMPLRAGSVDAVVALHTLIHVPNAEQPAAIDELARVLRPDGRLLVSDGPAAWAGRTPDWLGGGAAMAWEIAGAERTCGELRAAGFVVEETHEEAADEHWTFVVARLED